jgi:hypothetical protein
MRKEFPSEQLEFPVSLSEEEFPTLEIPEIPAIEQSLGRVQT